MTRPLPDDLRRRVVTAVDDGMSRRGAARRFGTALSTAIKWVRAWQRTGCYRPRPLSVEGLWNAIGKISQSFSPQ